MRGMILAAGRGERMGVLTQNTPKPLLKVRGRYLIEHAIQSFKEAGIHEIVINVSYLKEKIMEAIGDGSRYGVKITYSIEEERLETGGGIVKALPLLGSEPFVVYSADVITDYPLAELFKKSLKLAHLILVKHPAYSPDFYLNGEAYTFASLGIYHPDLFKGHLPVYSRLPDIWQEAIKNNQVTGEFYSGLWYNVGSPQELNSLAT